MPEMNLKRPSFVPWIWASAVIAFVTGLMSPILMMLAYGVCHQPEDPTGRILLIPAQPTLMMLDLMNVESLPAFGVAIGLSYGLPILAIGVLVTALRRARNRN